MAKKREKSIFNFVDFRGGYATDIAQELMPDNMLRQAENCYWNGGLRKRQGLATHATFNGASMKGLTRVYANGQYYHVAAVDDGSTVEFRQATAGQATFSTITMASGTNYTFTAGKNVEFAALGDKLIGVNGTDRPAAFFPTSSAIFAQPLDQYDERSRDTDNWYAGQYDGSASTYTDDTTDAQDAGAADFGIASTSFTNGFYVACDFTYSKLVFTGVDPGAMGSASAAYQYFDTNGSWTALGTMNATAANASGTVWGTGTCTLEFELPMSTDGTLKWQRYTESEGNLTDRYVTRTVFSGLASAITCDSATVAHSHYLTQIIGDQRPQAIYTHKNHVFMAAGNQVQIGVANTIKDWRADRWEYFYEGGAEIVAMITHNTYLAVLKPGAIFAIDGTSWQNWSTRTVANKGTVAPRGVAVANNILWHVHNDGLYAFDGTKQVKVSTHIRSNIESWTLTDAAMGVFKNYVYLSFPTNSIVLVFDPDTFRADQVNNIGEGIVSFYKYTPFLSRGFMETSEAYSASGLYFMGTNYMGLGENGVAYDNLTTTVPINWQIATKDYDFGAPHTEKLLGRVKVTLLDVSATAGISHALTLRSADTSASSPVTLSAAVGTGTTEHMVMTPANLDGRFLAFYLQHNTSYEAGVTSISVETRERRF